MPLRLAQFVRHLNQQLQLELAIAEEQFRECVDRYLEQVVDADTLRSTGGSTNVLIIPSLTMNKCARASAS